MKAILPAPLGLVGQELLKQALANPEITVGDCTNRKTLAAHPKLFNPFDPVWNVCPLNETWWQADVMLCALRITIKQPEAKQSLLKSIIPASSAQPAIAKARAPPALFTTLR